MAKWNEDRGFGFIAPAEGRAELFVHISAFPRDGKRPQVGELISFEIEAGAEGKSRAVRVMRPGGQAKVRASRNHRERPRGWRWIRDIAVGLLAIVVIGMYFHGKSGFPALSSFKTTEASTAPDRAETSELPDPAAKCDGRTMCSQMTSCAEAKYFLKHCPNTKMDGNNDGEPCEQQWCN